jgi:hypothetical protein
MPEIHTSWHVGISARGVLCTWYDGDAHRPKIVVEEVGSGRRGTSGSQRRGGLSQEMWAFLYSYEVGHYVCLVDHALSGPYKGEYCLEWIVRHGARPVVEAGVSYACGPFPTEREAAAWAQECRRQVPVSVRYEDETEEDDSGHTRVVMQWGVPQYDHAALDGLPYRPTAAAALPMEAHYG